MSDCSVCGKYVPPGEGLKHELITSGTKTESTSFSQTNHNSSGSRFSFGATIFGSGKRNYSGAYSRFYASSQGSHSSEKQTIKTSMAVKTICIECGLPFALEDFERFWKTRKFQIESLEKRIQDFRVKNDALRTEKAELEAPGIISRLLVNVEAEFKRVTDSLVQSNDLIAALQHELNLMKKDDEPRLYSIEKQLFPIRYFFELYMRNAHSQTKADRKVANAQRALATIVDNRPSLVDPEIEGELRMMIDESVAFITEFQIGDFIKEAKLHEALGKLQKAKEAYEYSLGVLLSDDIPDTLQSRAISMLKEKIREISTRLENKNAPFSSPSQQNSPTSRNLVCQTNSGSVGLNQNSSKMNTTGNPRDQFGINVNAEYRSIVDILGHVIVATGGMAPKKEKIVKAYFKDLTSGNTNYSRELFRLLGLSMSNSGNLEAAAQIVNEKIELDQRNEFFLKCAMLGEIRGYYSEDAVTVLNQLARFLNVDPIEFE